MSVRPSRHHRFPVFLSLLASCAMLPAAHAGLSLDQALQRHRQLIEIDAGRLAGFTPLADPADGLTLAAGSEINNLPQLLASPLGTGGSGLHAVHTWTDGSGGLRMRLGVLVREEASRHATLAGTELSLGTGTGEFYASHQTRHWGPSWTGSLFLDAASPSLPAVGWRKTERSAFETRWLSWLGPWNADFFIGRLDGHAQPAHPWLIGMRVEVQPLPSLQIGASRTLQFGGSGRDQSLGNLWRGLTGSDHQGGTPDEPGNQLAGLDARWHHTFDAGRQLALYGQLAGEDSRNLAPYKFLGLAGIEWATQHHGHALRLLVEHANTTAGSAFGTRHPGVAYRHHIYPQGYTHENRSLGHPAGGDVEITTLGLLVDGGAWSGALLGYDGRALPTAQRLAPGSVRGVNGSLAWQPQPGMTLGAGLWHGRSAGQRDSAAQLWWQHAWP